VTSDEERIFFERHHWRYDHIACEWIAPDDFRISTETLVVAADLLPQRDFETQLKGYIREHGRRS
jgi:hypothetical protein